MIDCTWMENLVMGLHWDGSANHRATISSGSTLTPYYSVEDTSVHVSRLVSIVMKTIFYIIVHLKLIGHEEVPVLGLFCQVFLFLKKKGL